MYLLAKFGRRTRYRFVGNEAISYWVISKRSTNTELETDVSRDVNFDCITLTQAYAHLSISYIRAQIFVFIQQNLLVTLQIDC